MLPVDIFDVTVEQPIGLRAACDLPEVRHDTGEAIAFSTLWKWAIYGRDGVKLQAVRRPRGLCTSRESIARFYARLSGAPSPTAVRESVQKHRRAAKHLAASGIQ